MDLAIDQTATRSWQSLAGGWASLGLRPVLDFTRDRQLLIDRTVGHIVTEQGRLRAVHGRWWPYQGNWLRGWLDRRFRSGSTDRCDLFYHQPLGLPGFLALSYVRSGPRTRLETFYVAALALDEIARIRAADAIVCHVTNPRLSDRLLRRWGWQQHCHSWRGRHFIKRFYGNYSPLSECWQRRLSQDALPTGIKTSARDTRR